MKKDEYIAKYGEDWYNSYIERCKKYNQKNKEQLMERSRKWYRDNKKRRNKQSTERARIKRAKGSTKYCRVNFDLIENYELAKADNFDKKKWHLHHRLENYWSVRTLKRKGLYFSVNPEALIWLPIDEHRSDSAISVYHPELSKWHQRRLERE